MIKVIHFGEKEPENNNLKKVEASSILAINHKEHN